MHQFNAMENNQAISGTLVDPHNPPRLAFPYLGIQSARICNSFSLGREKTPHRTLQVAFLSLLPARVNQTLGSETAAPSGEYTHPPADLSFYFGPLCFSD